MGTPLKGTNTTLLYLNLPNSRDCEEIMFAYVDDGLCRLQTNDTVGFDLFSLFLVTVPAELLARYVKRILLIPRRSQHSVRGFEVSLPTDFTEVERSKVRNIKSKELQRNCSICCTIDM